MEQKTIKLEWFNGTEWVFVSDWYREDLAWISLGGDDYNYRTINLDGDILTDKSGKSFEII